MLGMAFALLLVHERRQIGLKNLLNCHKVFLQFENKAWDVLQPTSSFEIKGSVSGELMRKSISPSDQPFECYVETHFQTHDFTKPVCYFSECVSTQAPHLIGRVDFIIIGDCGFD